MTRTGWGREHTVQKLQVKRGQLAVPDSRHQGPGRGRRSKTTFPRGSAAAPGLELGVCLAHVWACAHMHCPAGRGCQRPARVLAWCCPCAPNSLSPGDRWPWEVNRLLLRTRGPRVVHGRVLALSGARLTTWEHGWGGWPGQRPRTRRHTGTTEAHSPRQCEGGQHATLRVSSWL